jgi:hypothetical protein
VSHYSLEMINTLARSSQMKKLLILILPFLLLNISCASKKTASSADAQIITQGPVSLKILTPKPEEVLADKDVSVTFDLQNYELQPNGQHIHVILDNEPYQPCYSVKTPFVLKDLKPGMHTIRAFPSLAWHESIKDPQAFADVTFYVQKKENAAEVNFDKDPVLTYSRPKGKYEGEKAKKILFDFWVKNTKLSPEGNKVKYKLDSDKPQFITDWKPRYFENLKAGKHTLVVQLVDKKGKAVKGKFNKTEREFEVSP